MADKIVTVKLPKNPAHNPNAKVTGPCPVSGKMCTDVTGEHHTVILSEQELVAHYTQGVHITRVEDL